MTTRINAISTTPDGCKLKSLTDRQVAIVLAAIRHAQTTNTDADWLWWIEEYPTPQDDELEELCALLSSSACVAIEETTP